jgi:hypothetical protein
VNEPGAVVVNELADENELVLELRWPRDLGKVIGRRAARPVVEDGRRGRRDEGRKRAGKSLSRPDGKSLVLGN